MFAIIFLLVNHIDFGGNDVEYHNRSNVKDNEGVGDVEKYSQRKVDQDLIDNPSYGAEDNI